MFKKMLFAWVFLVGFESVAHADPLYCHEISIAEYCYENSMCYRDGNMCYWR